MATEDKSKVSATPLSSEDEKVTQKSLDHPGMNGTPKVTTKWTGFQGKTLWDWLQPLGVLAIPLVVVGATLLFSMQQANLAQQQHENDLKLADLQHQQDQTTALDQQRQATLVKYQDDMRDLLLNKGLLTSQPGDEIRVVALTLTLSAMSQLDTKRITFLIRFLENAHLNGSALIFFADGSESTNEGNYNIVNFSGADLSAIDFTNTDLTGANLSGAYLDGAHLSDTILNFADLSRAVLYRANLSNAVLLYDKLYGAHLSNADLSGADLTGAHLEGADLEATHLSGAYLSGAHLEGADLRGAFLYGAHLYGADLRNAQGLTQQQLDQVLTCKGAILPQGLTCNNNITPSSP